MTKPNLPLIVLSHPTYVGASGATAAATYPFFSRDYKPPQHTRDVDYDVVHNQNGKFKYLYDNGPGFRQWNPFTVLCEDSTIGKYLNADAATQYSRLQELWAYPGVLQMMAPEGIYNVHWAQSLDQSFKVFPKAVGDTPEYEVVVQFEEA